MDHQRTVGDRYRHAGKPDLPGQMAGATRFEARHGSAVANAERADVWGSVG
jgi:hypothetical protein